MEEAKNMALGFYFDMTRCVGCRACQVACKDRNNLDIGQIAELVAPALMLWCSYNVKKEAGV